MNYGQTDKAREIQIKVAAGSAPAGGKREESTIGERILSNDGGCHPSPPRVSAAEPEPKQRPRIEDGESRMANQAEERFGTGHFVVRHCLSNAERFAQTAKLSEIGIFLDKKLSSSRPQRLSLENCG